MRYHRRQDRRRCNLKTSEVARTVYTRPSATGAVVHRFGGSQTPPVDDCGPSIAGPLTGRVHHGWRRQHDGPSEETSVPDGLIHGSFSYWFEVKTARDAVRRAQLVAHMRSLSSEREHERLFVVSPDATQPAVIAELADDRVQWFPFVALSEAIDGHLDGTSDKTGDMPFVSE